jgi:Zn-dependent protease
MGLLAALVIRAITPEGEGLSFVGRVLFLALQLNVLLAVFNMVPVPPLDGGNVLAGLLRGSASDMFDRLRPYGFVIIYGLMLSGVLWTIVSPIENWILSILL